jgi:hypothetical protein
MGDEFFDKGERQEITLYSKNDRLGKTLLKFMKALDAVENHVEEIIEGHLFADPPEELRKTKLGHSQHHDNGTPDSYCKDQERDQKYCSIKCQNCRDGAARFSQCDHRNACD